MSKEILIEQIRSELEILEESSLLDFIKHLYDELLNVGKDYEEMFSVKMNPLLMNESIKIMTLNGNPNQESLNKMMAIQSKYFNITDLPYQEIIVNESWEDVEFAFKKFLMKLKDNNNLIFVEYFRKIIEYYVGVSLLNNDFGQSQRDYIIDLIQNLDY